MWIVCLTWVFAWDHCRWGLVDLRVLVDSVAVSIWYVYNIYTHMHARAHTHTHTRQCEACSHAYTLLVTHTHAFALCKAHTCTHTLLYTHSPPSPEHAHAHAHTLLFWYVISHWISICTLWKTGVGASLISIIFVW